MASRRFLPNSPCLVNAGRELGQLSACFVLPVDDSIEGIYGAVQNAAVIHKSGGGTGFAFDRIRAKDSPVGSTSGLASGPVTFMQVFDKGTWAIKQGGTRRGANMGILSVNHPDIMEFIDLKGTLDDDKTPLENFNVSVGVTDEFMTALTIEDDPEAMQTWKSTDLSPFDIWCRMSENAWRTGDPGVVFLDRINEDRSNPVPSYGPIESVNPCGEQPLYPYDSCNLGSINLERHIDADFKRFDWDALQATVELAVQFLDDVITVNKYPLPQIENVTKSIRRIGLGVMGWADSLIQFGVRYDAPEALDRAAGVMSFIQQFADNRSVELGKQRGSFPMFSQSIYATTHEAMRNSTRTTIAPTGSISIIAGCSAGIEPIYSAAYRHRHKLDRSDADAWFEMFDINPAFKKYLDRRVFIVDDRSTYAARIADEETTISDLVTKGVFDNDALLFRGANEIHYRDHIRMQAAFQRWTDNGVSKTINLPESASDVDIQGAYLYAYETGCKGVTVYRNNCRNVQVYGAAPKVAAIDTGGPNFTVIQNGATGEVLDIVKELTEAFYPVRRKLPDERNSITHKFQIGDFEGYLTVGLYDDGTPGEVFVQASKQGSTFDGMIDTVAVLTSYALQYGIPLRGICDKLKGRRFDPEGMTRNRSIPTTTSIIDYIFRWLELKFLDPVTPATFSVDAPLPVVDARRQHMPMASLLPHRQGGNHSGQMCPDCGSMLIYSEGCSKCPQCGFENC